MKIVFIDDEIHKETNSTEFIVNLLEKEHEVKRVWGSGFKSYPDYKIRKINKMKPDLLIFFQRMPLYPIMRKFECKNWLFIPMHDNNQNFNTLQKTIAGIDYTIKVATGMKTLFFCLEDYINASPNANGLYVKYFPEIQKQSKQEKPILLFWERTNDFKYKDLERLFILNYFEKIYYLRRPDKGQRIKKSKLAKNTILIDKWLPKEEYEKIKQECNIAIAPRKLEGIGHTFLEYMARGMCVYAYDGATHNEYIKDWTNGILFKELDEPQHLYKDWREKGKEARNTIKEGKNNWEKDKEMILEWIK